MVARLFVLVTLAFPLVAGVVHGTRPAPRCTLDARDGVLGAWETPSRGLVVAELPVWALLAVSEGDTLPCAIVLP